MDVKAMAYSLDFRQHVMKMKAQLGLSYQKTSDRFGVSIQSLFRWAQRIEPCTSYAPYVKKLDPNDLLKDVEQYPDAYQRERAERLGVSESAIWQALKKLNISRKKKLTTSKSRPSKTSRVSAAQGRVSGTRSHYYRDR